MSFVGYQLLVPGAAGGGGKVGACGGGRLWAWGVDAKLRADVGRVGEWEVAVWRHDPQLHPTTHPPNRHRNPPKQKSLPDADASVTTGSALLPPTQSGCLSWLRAAGVAVGEDNAVAQGFAAAVEEAERWMEKRDELGEQWVTRGSLLGDEWVTSG
jgi:hypothetical protein